ncbi:bacillithiol system redox-active protein YtxJ [Sporosarcina sp. FSL K6-1522]|uniref:bacillithiol system redox-active protein YtxJ n=1 Tax=Sporosarcina sp. FSL K6-1522 TaxID=2921554 RepID=UPI00315A46FE
MKELQAIEEWHDVLEQSKEAPLFVLKHSMTCPVSIAAFSVFEAYTTTIPKYFLTVQDSRPVSNEIERDLGIRHESPQLFLLKDGKGIWQATHYAISKAEIGKAVEEYIERA